MKKLFLVLVAILAAVASLLFASSVQAQDDKQAFAPTTLEEWRKIGESIVHAAQPQIAFTSGGNIYVINQDGTNLRQVTRGSSPSFSPDGRSIVFIREDGGKWITVLELSSGSIKNLGVRGEDPRWSPDGKMIASGGPSVGIITPDGALIRRANAGAYPAHLSWSPDSGKIAIEDLGDSNIYTINTDGTGLKKLTESLPSGQGVAYNTSPSFTPDGTQIVYGYYVIKSGVGFLDRSIRIMDLNGGNKRVVLNTPESVDATSVSPDGSLIAFDSADGRRGGLYVVNTGGFNQRLLYDSGARSVKSTTWFDPRFAKPSTPKWDVNRDGITDILDLVLVAKDFGGPAIGSSDINGDGAVDIGDLILVALHFGERSDGALASPALLETRKQLVERLGQARSPEEVKSVLNDFIPQVKSQGKLPTTWGRMKTK